MSFIACYRECLDSKKCLSIALLLIRIQMGVAFMFHGWMKIQSPMNWMGEGAPIPGILQALAAISEFGGGLALLLGLLVPLASFGLLCTMAVAAYYHISKGDPFVGMAGSWEMAAVYLVLAYLFFTVGPGKYSLDRLLFGKKSN